MNFDIIEYQFDETNKIRTFTDENENIFFVAKDVAIALGYTRFNSTLLEHIPNEWKDTKPIGTLGGKQQMSVLLESGLYFFLARSDKPKAIPFQKWLAGEVIPSIRKTGTYSIPQQKSEILKPNQNINFVEQLQNLKEYKDFSFEVLDFIDNLQSRNKLVLYRFDKFMRAQFNEQPLKRFQIDLENEYFIPTKLGEFINVSAIEMNRILEKNGFQIRENNSWKLTEKARDFAIEIPNKSYIQFKWNLKTISEFK